MVESERRGMKAVARNCSPRRSARLGSGPHSAGSFNGGVESAEVAAASGGTSRRRPSRSVKALRERNPNVGCTSNAQKLVKNPLRRSPRFETQKADCGSLEKIQKRRSPRLVASVYQGGNKENERYSVHGDGLVRPDVVKLKKEGVKKREPEGNRDETSLLDLRKSPISAPHNASRRSNYEIYGTTPRRKSPRFIDGASDEEKENEHNVVHNRGLVHHGWEEKDGRKKVAKDLRVEIVQNARRRAPMFVSPDEVQRPKCPTPGRTPNLSSPKFVHAISDEDRKENEEDVILMRANVREDVKTQIQKALNCRIESFSGKESKGVTAKVKEKDERSETKNSIGQSAARELTEKRNIVSEKFTSNGGLAGRKRSASSDLLKDDGGEKKLREYSGSHNKEVRAELEVQHHGYHDDYVKRKSGTLLGSFGFLGWSQDQEKALERAYLVTKPSPHFWREIAKLVPGKSAKECFDRIHSIIPTPPTQQPRSRTKSKLSPLGPFSLTGSVPFEQFGLKGRISGKRKSLLARRAVRHILRKHVLADQGCVPDLGLEGSCSRDQGPSEMRKLTVQNNKLKSPCLEMDGESEQSGSRNKMRNIVTPLQQQALVSPEILKKVKNLDLHEKYIDRLHIREQTRGRKAAIKRTDPVPAETKEMLMVCRQAREREAQKTKHEAHVISPPDRENQQLEKEVASTHILFAL
ncbi:unnamed protein product [Victoria cruziana]